ncbi:MAG: ATP synthase subunit I [Nitrospirota bacterium]
MMIDRFLKRVEIRGALIILALGFLMIFIWDVMVAVSFVFGGVLGLVNIRWITKTVRGITESRNPSRAKGAVLFFYLLKLGIIGLVLIITLKTGNVSPPALLSGFTIIILIILFEGIISARKI